MAQLLARRRGRDPVEQLTSREKDVLAHMAEGRSNAGISAALHLSESAVTKHINAIFTKLGIPPAASDNRRVLAVLRYLASDDGGEADGGPRGTR